MSPRIYPWLHNKITVVANAEAEDPCFGEPTKEIKIMLGEERVSHIYGYCLSKLSQEDLDRLGAEIARVIDHVREHVNSDTLKRVRESLGIVKGRDGNLSC